jgi:hypothetical protein
MTRLGFASVHAEPVRVPRWERGEERGELVAPYRQRIPVAALGGSVGTPDGGVEAELLRVESLEELDRLDEPLVRGRIVFIDLRTRRSRSGVGYGAAAPIRSQGAIRAGRKGAVGVLIRSVGTSANRLPHTGGMHYDDSVPKIPAAAVSNPDADLLADALARSGSIRFRLELGCRALPEGESANVVGEIVGGERPEEIVLIGGHLDSWDLGSGALDDAAGCAVALTTGRFAAEAPRPPRRTIRVVLFSNEEFGVSGGEAYVVRHADELARHVLAMEADLGSGCVLTMAPRVGAPGLPIVDEIAGLLAPLGVAYSGANDGSGGVDIGPLRRRGVPVISLSQDATSYFDHHHSANDTFDKVQPLELDQVVASFATAVLAAAEADGDFGRLAGE